jgi:hypothetical protein
MVVFTSDKTLMTATSLQKTDSSSKAGGIDIRQDINDSYFSTKDRLVLQGCSRLGPLIGLVERRLLVVNLGAVLPSDDEVEEQLGAALPALQGLLGVVIECLAEKLDGLEVGLGEVRRCLLELVGRLADLGLEKLRMMWAPRRSVRWTTLQLALLMARTMGTRGSRRRGGR